MLQPFNYNDHVSPRHLRCHSPGSADAAARASVAVSDFFLALTMDPNLCTRWPREVLVFGEGGFDIRFQSSMYSVPSPAEGLETDLSEIVAELEAKFALQYPHVLKSPRQSAEPSPRRSVAVKSPDLDRITTPRRVKKVLTVEEKNMKRIAALQRLEDIQLEQCTFRQLGMKLLEIYLQTDRNCCSPRLCPNSLRIASASQSPRLFGPQAALIAPLLSEISCSKIECKSCTIQSQHFSRHLS